MTRNISFYSFFGWSQEWCFSEGLINWFGSDTPIVSYLLQMSSVQSLFYVCNLPYLRNKANIWKRRVYVPKGAFFQFRFLQFLKEYDDQSNSFYPEQSVLFSSLQVNLQIRTKIILFVTSIIFLSCVHIFQEPNETNICDIYL